MESDASLVACITWGKPMNTAPATPTSPSPVARVSRTRDVIARMHQCPSGRSQSVETVVAGC
jgi:hypothetical protein